MSSFDITELVDLDQKSLYGTVPVASTSEVPFLLTIS